MKKIKLQKRSAGIKPHKNWVYQICLPKHMIKNLKWKKGRKLNVEQVGRSIVIDGGL